MKAHVGDRLVLKGTHVDDPGRVGVVIELRHDDGTPPYVVRWLDTGHEALVFPVQTRMWSLRGPAAPDRVV